MYYGSERYREGGREVDTANIITLIFLLNGINELEDVCFCSTEKEGKLTVKNTAIIHLATDVCGYATLEFCHSVGSTDEKM